MKKIILTLVCVIGLLACSPAALTTNARAPADATNLDNVGNGWYTFEWRKQCFLYKSGGKGSYGLGHITTINCIE